MSKDIINGANMNKAGVYPGWKVRSAVDSAAEAAKTEVEVTQVLTEGTKIASISVDGDSTDLYAPEGGGEEFVVNFEITYTGDWPGDGSAWAVENATVTADKSGSEVYAAYQAGKKIVAVFTYDEGDIAFHPNLITRVDTWEEDNEGYIGVTAAQFLFTEGIHTLDALDGIVFNYVYADVSDEIGAWAWSGDDSGYRYFYTPEA